MADRIFGTGKGEFRMYQGRVLKNRHGQRLGFDGPVEVILPGTVAAERDAKAFAALVQDSAPIDRGTLRKDLSLRRATWRKLPKPRVGFQIGPVPNSYAYVQDQGTGELPGGVIPERLPRGYIGVELDGQTLIDDGDKQAGEALMWMNANGVKVFAKRAGPFALRAKNYVQRGFDRWITSRGHGGAVDNIRWAPAYGGGR